MTTTTANRRTLMILSFTLVVVMLGFGLVIPIFPFFVEDLGAGGRELGLLVATSALLEFVFAPVWGGVSDRIGRKPVLMIGVVGYGLSSLLFGLSTQLWLLIFLLLPESLSVENRRKGGAKIGTVNFRELRQAISSPIGVLLLMVALASSSRSLCYRRCRPNPR